MTPTTKKYPADSPEALASFYADKLRKLEVELNQFNLLEHPKEIRSLCCKMIVLKNMMRAAASSRRIIPPPYSFERDTAR